MHHIYIFSDVSWYHKLIRWSFTYGLTVNFFFNSLIIRIGNIRGWCLFTILHFLVSWDIGLISFSNILLIFLSFFGLSYLVLCHNDGTFSYRMQFYEQISHVRPHLKSFNGVFRRFEMIGTICGCHICDDYAHHTTEICAVLQAAWQRFPFKAIWVVFQPHSYRYSHIEWEQRRFFFSSLNG